MFDWILVLTLCNAEGKCASEPIARAMTFEQCDKVADAYIATAYALPDGLKGVLDCQNPKGQVKGART